MILQSTFRGFIVTLLVVTLSASLWAERSRPNVLLILSDDHSVPHVSCYDDENTKRFKITPNLRKFAEQGMRFDRAYTSAPQCAPSRISIFACRSPVGLGVTRFAQPPRGDVFVFLQTCFAQTVTGWDWTDAINISTAVSAKPRTLTGPCVKPACRVWNSGLITSCDQPEPRATICCTSPSALALLWTKCLTRNRSSCTLVLVSRIESSH